MRGRSRAFSLFGTCLVGLLLCFSGVATADRPYSAIFNENHQGDITGTGNTLMSCFAVDPRCAAARNGTASGGNLNNNNLAMDWVDVDGVDSTFNSSAATLELPPGARVLKAILVYTGRLQQGVDQNCPQAAPPAAPCLRARAAPNPDRRDRVLFRPPGANGYETLTAHIVDDAVDETTGIAREYQGIVDVSDIVRDAGPGEYTVADVQLGTGLDADQAGGWALAVAYEDASQPMRNLTMYTGFRFVLADGLPVDIPLSGFTTPKEGPVRTTVGLVAIEGDLGTTGDSATINATGSGAATVNCPVAAGSPCRLNNAANPATNFFNASISDRNGQTFTQRRPDFLNQMGFDADVINGAGSLTNDQSSTTIRLATSGDGFAPNGVSFATDLFAPSLTVHKTVSPTGAVQLGDVLTYTVDATNTGQDAAVNTILTDEIPAGTTFVPGSLRILAGANAGAKTDSGGDDQAEFDGTDNAVVFRLGEGAGAAEGGRLAIGAGTEIQFQVRVDSQGVPSGFEVVNNAGVSFLADTLGTPGEVHTPDVVTPVLIPDLTIEKSHTGPLQAGRRTPFTLVVSNVGDADSRGPIAVVDRLPAVLSFATQPSGDGWDCSATSGRTLRCVRSDALPPNQSFPPIGFVARVAASAPPGELRNTALVLATPDGDPTNNKDTDRGPLARPLIDLAIAKTAVTPVAFPGDTVRFTIQITNAGPDTATRVRLRDVMGPGLTPISLSPSRGSCSGTTCSLGRMRPRTRATIQVDARAGADTGRRRLRDTAIVRAREDEVTLRNNVDSASVLIRPLVDLVVTKTPATQTVPDGGTVSWTVIVANDGPSTATNIRFADILPAPLQLVSATPLQGTCTGTTCSLGTLRAGDATQVAIVARGGPGLAGRTFRNIAAAAAREAELTLANNLAKADVTFSAVAPPPANVVVTKTASPAVINVGGQVTYRITATNQGPGTAEHAPVTDTLDAGLQLFSATPSQGTCTQTTPISCDVGPLAAGASATVVVVARATQTGPLRNGVTVVPGNGGDAEDVAGITVSSRPRVTIRKRADRRTVRPGGEARFTLTATARGQGVARQIRVCDVPPKSMTVTDPGGAQRDGPRWCWTIAALAAGRSRDLHLGVRVSAASGRTVTNLAVLTFADQAPGVARAPLQVRATAPSFTG